jgi:DNA-binding transcriptional ArsR family regulator
VILSTRNGNYKYLLVKRADKQIATALKALGEPRRVEILRLLQNGPQAVGELASQVAVTQQAVSLHLAVLERVGTRSVYAVRVAGFTPVEQFVRSFWTPRLAALKNAIENDR